MVTLINLHYNEMSNLICQKMTLSKMSTLNVSVPDTFVPSSSTSIFITRAHMMFVTTAFLEIKVSEGTQKLSVGGTSFEVKSHI